MDRVEISVPWLVMGKPVVYPRCRLSKRSGEDLTGNVFVNNPGVDVDSDQLIIAVQLLHDLVLTVAKVGKIAASDDVASEVGSLGAIPWIQLQECLSLTGSMGRSRRVPANEHCDDDRNERETGQHGGRESRNVDNLIGGSRNCQFIASLRGCTPLGSSCRGLREVRRYGALHGGACWRPRMSSIVASSLPRGQLALNQTPAPHRCDANNHAPDVGVV